jgi:hypothetical protein
MKTCSSCGSYSSDNADICEYCGEKLFKEYKAFSEIRNLFHPRRIVISSTVFPYEKNKQLCSKIDQEIQRVKDIENLLANIKNETIKDKIIGIIVQINGYIDSLVKCRCDIELYKIYGSLSALLVDSKKITSEDLVKYCNEFKEELHDTFREIKESYDRGYLEEYFEGKIKDLDKMIEDMSMLLISSILSNTSIIKELEYSPESDFKVLENNIDKINYEIDRLSAELAM